MRRLIAAMLMMLCGFSLFAQPMSPRIWTRPTVPPREVLDKLDLVDVWHVHIPVDGPRDGLRSVQLLPGLVPQILVQTFQGEVSLLNAESGDLAWRVQVSEPYWESEPAAFTDKMIITTRRDYLHFLDRFTGKELVYTLNQETKKPDYGARLQAPPSAAPMVYDNMVYLCLGNRLVGLHLPIFDENDPRRKLLMPDEQPIATEFASSQPLPAFIYPLGNLHVEHPVVAGEAQVGVVTTDGNYVSINRFENKQRFDFKTQGAVLAPMGQYKDQVLIGSDDYALYSIDTVPVTGTLSWRFLSGGPIFVKPAVLNKDVFVTSEGNGMFRLDRESGQSTWQNRDAYRFLARNARFVYAVDRRGALMVLDADRGLTLGGFDTHDWILPYSNELTDRIYFANHDGQILCLRNRAQTEPVFNQEPKIIPVEKKLPQKKAPAPKVEEKKEA